MKKGFALVETFVAWKDWYQPVLVEYRVVLASSGKLDTLVGSWLK